MCTVVGIDALAHKKNVEVVVAVERRCENIFSKKTLPLVSTWWQRRVAFLTTMTANATLFSAVRLPLSAHFAVLNVLVDWLAGYMQRNTRLYVRHTVAILTPTQTAQMARYP